MIGASIYITWCTAKNRLRVRLRRLREPRYLVGLVAGVAYFYFTIFARVRRPVGRAGRNAPLDFGAAFQAMGTSIAGLCVLLFSLMPWVFPVKSKVLEFSDAEKDLLFAAPVTRRQLLAHRVVRSQVSSLVASFLIAVFAAPLSGTGRLRLALSWWVLILTVNIYFAAVQLTRARLRSPALSVRAGAWAPIALYAGVLGIVGASVARQLMAPAAGAADTFVGIARATSTGLPRIVLWPFTAIIRSAFSPSSGFLPAMASSVVVLGVVTAWMLLGDVMFDAVAGEGNVRRDHGAQLAKPKARARDVGWVLPLAGRPELALFWKGAMETLRTTSSNMWRYLIPIAVITLGMTSAAMGASGMRQPAAIVSFVAGMIALVAIVFGPQIMRADLRTDLQHLELLKTWPLRAADAIRGEMSWPVVLVSGIASAAVLVSAVFSGTALPKSPFISRWSLALAAMIAGPALVAAQFTVHNATALIFPGWVQLGSQRTRGIDAMGQRLIMLAAILVSLAVFAIPGAIGGGVVWLLLNRLIGNVVFIPAAIVFAGIVFVEVIAATELLGPAYERIDLTSIERPE